MNKKSQNTFLTKKNIQPLLLGTFMAFLAGKILDPIFTYLYSLLINTQSTLTTILSNSTYRTISKGFSEDVSITNLCFLFAIVFSGLSFLFVHLRHFQKYSLEAYDNIEAHLNSPEPQTKELHTCTNELESLDEQQHISIFDIKNQRKQTKRICIIVYFEIAAILIMFVFMYSRSLFINSKITLLTNNIEIVSPYISDLEYKQLKSNFHSMENKNDYEQLSDSLLSIANSNSLKLKK